MAKKIDIIQKYVEELYDNNLVDDHTMETKDGQHWVRIGSSWVPWYRTIKLIGETNEKS